MHSLFRRVLRFAAVVCLLVAAGSAAPAGRWAPDAQEQGAAAPALTQEEMSQFLLKAKVVRMSNTKKGVTNPFRVSLSDGKLTHDAHFQPINQSKPLMQLASGTTELNFRDSYHFNIAAYEISRLLGLDHMMPVTVERKIRGESGSLSWWLDTTMDEAERTKKKISPPDVEAWNDQMHRMRVFSQLVYDTDRNLTNVLIGPAWKLYMVDFTRGFRLYKDLQNENDLVRCDRNLLESLRRLDQVEVAKVTKGHLNAGEVEALMARRDKILARFEKLVAEKGESAVLY